MFNMILNTSQLILLRCERSKMFSQKHFSRNLGLLFEVIFLFSRHINISIMRVAFESPNNDLSHRDSKETYFQFFPSHPPSQSVWLGLTSKDVQMIMSKSYSMILYLRSWKWWPQRSCNWNKLGYMPRFGAFLCLLEMVGIVLFGFVQATFWSHCAFEPVWCSGHTSASPLCFIRPVHLTCKYRFYYLKTNPRSLIKAYLGRQPVFVWECECAPVISAQWQPEQICWVDVSGVTIGSTSSHEALKEMGGPGRGPWINNH